MTDEGGGGEDVECEDGTGEDVTVDAGCGLCDRQ